MDPQISLSRLGGQIRDLRKHRGLTQAAVATSAGLPRLKIVQIEAGKGTVSAEAFAKVLAVFGAELKVVPASRPTLEEIEAHLK